MRHAIQACTTYRHRILTSVTEVRSCRIAELSDMLEDWHGQNLPPNLVGMLVQQYVASEIRAGRLMHLRHVLQRQGFSAEKLYRFGPRSVLQVRHLRYVANSAATRYTWLAKYYRLSDVLSVESLPEFRAYEHVTPCRLLRHRIGQKA